MLVVSLLGVGYAIVTNLTRVEALHRALDPGTFGGAVLVVGQAGYLPDLAAWGVAWLAGPGFAVGSGTVVSATTVKLGVLPVIPVFGALPGSPPAAGWLVGAAFAVPVLAGAFAGWRTARRADAGDLGLVSRLLDALVAAVLAAVLLGLAVALSRGAIGPGRLADVGANALVVTPFLALELALGALPAAAIAHLVAAPERAAPGSRGAGRGARPQPPPKPPCRSPSRRSNSDSQAALATSVLAPCKHCWR